MEKRPKDARGEEQARPDKDKAGRARKTTPVPTYEDRPEDLPKYEDRKTQSG